MRGIHSLLFKLRRQVPRHPCLYIPRALPRAGLACPFRTAPNSLTDSFKHIKLLVYRLTNLTHRGKLAIWPMDTPPLVVMMGALATSSMSWACMFPVTARAVMTKTIFNTFCMILFDAFNLTFVLFAWQTFFAFQISMAGATPSPSLYSQGVAPGWIGLPFQGGSKLPD